MHSWPAPTAPLEDCTRWHFGSPQACCAFRLAWENSRAASRTPPILHIPWRTYHWGWFSAKNNRIVIPSPECDDILKQIHYGHLGINKCQLRTRETVYWPGISKAIENIVSNCETCLKFSANNRKQSPDGTLCHEIPTIPWSKHVIDIFTFANNNYLVVVD